MHLLQALIFCAIVGSNIRWQWTPNNYLASGIGVGSLGGDQDSPSLARSTRPLLQIASVNPPAPANGI
jgi:hypothetical protein